MGDVLGGVGDFFFGGEAEAPQVVGQSENLTPQQKELLNSLIGRVQGLDTNTQIPGESPLQGQAFQQLQSIVGSGGVGGGARDFIGQAMATGGGPTPAPGVTGRSRPQLTQVNTTPTSQSTPVGAIPTGMTPTQMTPTQMTQTPVTTAGDVNEFFNTAFFQPSLQRFENEVLPAVQERFISSGAGRGPSANNALAKAGREFSTDMNAQLANLIFNTEQEQLGRQFQAGESFQGRNLSAGENFQARNLSAGESAAGRDLTSQEAFLNRLFGAGEAAAGREFQAGEAFQSREQGSQESELARLENQLTRQFAAGESARSRGASLVPALANIDLATINALMSGGATQRDISLQQAPQFDPIMSLIPSLLGTTGVSTPIIQQQPGQTGLVPQLLPAIGQFAGSSAGSNMLANFFGGGGGGDATLTGADAWWG